MYNRCTIVLEKTDYNRYNRYIVVLEKVEGSVELFEADWNESKTIKLRRRKWKWTETNPKWNEATDSRYFTPKAKVYRYSNFLPHTSQISNLQLIE